MPSGHEPGGGGTVGNTMCSHLVPSSFSRLDNRHVIQRMSALGCCNDTRSSTARAKGMQDSH